MTDERASQRAERHRLHSERDHAFGPEFAERISRSVRKGLGKEFGQEFGQQFGKGFGFAFSDAPGGGEEHSESIEQHFTVGDQPQLRLRNVSGESRITVGADREIRVRARKRVRGASEDRAKRLLENVEVRMEQSGDEVSVRPHLYEQDRGWLDLFRGGRVAVDFDIAVPRGTRIDATTVSGDLAVQGTRGSLEVQSVSGDVRLADVQGPMRLKTVSGDVSGTDVAGALDANSVSGDLSFDRCRIHGCEVVTVSGDFDLSGELEREREHRFKTISGDVALALGGRSYDVRFKTMSGDLDCALAGTVTSDGRREKHVLVGDGATRVVVKTVSGDLELRPGLGGMPEAPAAASTPASSDPQDTERTEPMDRPDRPDRPEPIDRTERTIRIERLDPTSPAPGAADGTREILERLARGELDVDAAGRALDDARGRR